MTAPIEHTSAPIIIFSPDNTLLPAAWADIRYEGRESGIVAMDNWGAIEMGLGFFEKNIGSSNNYLKFFTFSKVNFQ